MSADGSSEPVAGRDPEIESTRAGSAASLFDIRRVIGGLFTFYGVLVLGAGLVDGADASNKASGIDINIWTGIGMLVLGLGMLAWMWLRPTAVAALHDEDDDDDIDDIDDVDDVGGQRRDDRRRE